ncbi:hypothetical protein CsSME_00028379 [Camellia sinensis var. sinensis]
MNEEFQALQQQEYWRLVSLSSTKTVIGCKCAFQIKTNSNGVFG